MRRVKPLMPLSKRRRRVPRNRVGHTPEVGVDSRGDYDCERRPAFNTRAHEAGVLEFCRRVRRHRVSIVEFLHGKRLARQCSLADEQVLCGKHPHIARNHVAGGELNDVSGNQVAQGKLAGLAIANHGSRHVDHGFQLRRGRFGTRLLEEAQSCAEHHHPSHDAPGAGIACGKGNRAEYREQDHQRVAEDDQESEEPAAPPFLRDYIRPGLSRPAFRFRLRQTFAGGAQRTKQFIAVLACRIKDSG